MIKLEHVSKAYSAGYLLSMMSIWRLMMESLFSYAEIVDPVNPL